MLSAAPNSPSLNRDFLKETGVGVTSIEIRARKEAELHPLETRFIYTLLPFAIFL
jgi:hypothetical protein